MGKKKLEKITKILNACQRNVCLCKRKKGLLKKTMELSVLCDLKIFLFMYDPNQKRVTHFASHSDLDIVDLFNQRNQREFYSNMDYQKVGGNIKDMDSEFLEKYEDKPVFKTQSLPIEDELQANEYSHDLADLSENSNHPKIFSSKRKNREMTSQLGSLQTQR